MRATNGENGYWQFRRQDDKGNRFLVAEFRGRDAAQARMEELSRSLHKQIYWLEAPAKSGARHDRHSG